MEAMAQKKSAAAKSVTAVPARSRSNAEQNGTLASLLTGRVRDAILRGDFPPGEKLRLDEMRQAFGVSLSPLREALSRLAAEGLVVGADQRGYRVAPVSARNLEEIIRLRVELECMALAAAMRNGDEDWEASVLAAFHRLSRIEERTPRNAQLQEWEERHREFHFAMLAACEMPVLLQFCRTLHDFFDRYRRVFLARSSLDDQIPTEHEALLKAVIERRQKKALELTRSHIERIGAIIRTAVEKSDQEKGRGSSGRVRTRSS